MNRGRIARPGPRRLLGGGPARPAWVRAATRGEHLLAEAPADDGRVWLLATRSRLVAVPDPESGNERPHSWPWDEVQSVEWDRETGRLRVLDVGEYGERRDRADYTLTGNERLLRVIRERVTASVVLQRHVRVADRRGFTVIGRRNPAGGPVRWMHEYDPGVDPQEPEVARLAAAALARARDEVGRPE